MAKNKNRIGVAGECYVAGKLSEMGYYIALTARATVGVDILVSNGTACKNIQVKTTAGGKPDWWCTSQITVSRDFVYVFVCLNNGLQPPDYYIVPGKYVEQYLKRDEKSHYKFRDKAHLYKDKWQNLKMSPAK